MTMLGEVLRTWRKAKQLTLREVAASTDIPFQTLAKLETTGQIPQADTLIKLLKWLTSEAPA